jgi:hypothetical protein
MPLAKISFLFHFAYINKGNNAPTLHMPRLANVSAHN